MSRDEANPIESLETDSQAERSRPLGRSSAPGLLEDSRRFSVSLLAGYSFATDVGVMDSISVEGYSEYVICTTRGTPGFGLRAELLSRSEWGGFVALGFDRPQRCDRDDTPVPVTVVMGLLETGLSYGRGPIRASLDVNVAVVGLGPNGPATTPALGFGASIRYLVTDDFGVELALRKVSFRQADEETLDDRRYSLMFPLVRFAIRF